MTATALVSLAPPPESFRRGRDFAAWLGLTPAGPLEESERSNGGYGATVRGAEEPGWTSASSAPG